MKEGYGTLSYTNGEKYEVLERELDSAIIVTVHGLHFFPLGSSFAFQSNVYFAIGLSAYLLIYLSPACLTV
jgi:hypothetical protein